jgi:ElaB/YqjD/DUF883 family membrane-anchored ribosome-binding protein
LLSTREPRKDNNLPSAFSRFRGDFEDDLEAQVARLSKEVAGLKKAMSERGPDAYDDARDAAADFYEGFRDRLADALPTVKRRVSGAGQIAHDNPTTAALVGLIVVGLLATMLLRR